MLDDILGVLLLAILFTFVTSGDIVIAYTALFTPLWLRQFCKHYGHTLQDPG